MNSLVNFFRFNVGMSMRGHTTLTDLNYQVMVESYIFSTVRRYKFKHHNGKKDMFE